MQIRGLTLAQFTEITHIVSEIDYGGNVIVHQDAQQYPSYVQARLAVKDSYAYGARTSWTGRHTRSASWEAYRDVLLSLFNVFPNARVKTAMARYEGINGFLDNYPSTAYINVGSMAQPCYMPGLSVPAEGHSRGRARVSRELPHGHGIDTDQSDWEHGDTASRSPAFIP
jgi:hypothetical protein